MTLGTLISAEDLFEGLEREEASRDAEFRIEKSNSLLEIIEGFKVFNNSKIIWGLFEEIYSEFRLESRVPKNYSARDITDFTLYLGNYKSKEMPRITAFYLAALINKCPEREIRLITNHLSERIDYLGFRNKDKNVTIIGDAGTGLGLQMSGGSIIVKGSCSGFTCNEISGGSVKIEGDVAGSLGSSMTGGFINVAGDVFCMGTDMRNGKTVIDGNVMARIASGIINGEIHINGEYSTYAECSIFPNELIFGKLYHKGNLIYENGRRV